MGQHTLGVIKLTTTIDANTVALAEALAHIAHSGQHDKAGKPYIFHVARVAARVADDPLAETVAWLHDVLEDCPAYADDVHAFPAEVLDAVKLLSRSENLPAETYYARIRQSPVALRVKAADLADNADDGRLALLPEATADRLRAKYAHARQELGINEPDTESCGDVA